MRGPIDVDSESWWVSLVVCVKVEGVLEVDEVNLAAFVALDFDVNGLGVDTGKAKRRRGRCRRRGDLRDSRNPLACARKRRKVQRSQRR